MAESSQDIGVDANAPPVQPTDDPNSSVSAGDNTQARLAASGGSDSSSSVPSTHLASTQSANQTTSAAASLPTPKPKKTIYHGIMEGYSVQFLDGAADVSDLADIDKYGQYTPLTTAELQQMREDRALLAVDSADAQPKATFPIMNLPAELRLKIWEFAIVDETVDLVDFCHDHDCHYEERTDHPWYKARCFFLHYGPSINDVAKDYHKNLRLPGLNLLLIDKTICGEVASLPRKKRHFNIQAGGLECAQMIAKSCPYVKSVAFPIPVFSSVLDRPSFTGRTGVQWWARYIARHLAEFPDNSISKVVFWAGEKPPQHPRRTEERMIYHRLDFVDSEPGKERWNVHFTGSF